MFMWILYSSSDHDNIFYCAVAMLDEVVQRRQPEFEVFARPMANFNQPTTR
jgi:hypothetical protein